jgi:hypothetical protein
LSYWCGFEDDKDDSINMTSNVACMWRLAGADLAEMNGKPAGEVKVILATAVRNMLAEPEKYKAMNPENGWGDYEGCIDYLMRLAIMAGNREDPATPFYASH